MKRTFCVCVALLKAPRSTMLATNDSTNLITNFKEWKFKYPPSYAELPIDENPEYNIPMAVKNAVFSKVPTEPLTGDLKLVCKSEDALTKILDLVPGVAEQEEFVDFVAGKYLPDGGLTVCHRYGGYQFGFWSDQLGDGRAHILGEYVNSKGESWQPQLKGSGETPYSRFGDGRAVLRSSVREMLASEACHALGVPTTRAAALVVSDSHKVWRDKFYTGAAREERAACVVRLAPAWVRLGSVEILAKRAEPDTMRKLLDHTVKHYFKEIDPSDEDRYVKLFSEVAHRNLDMVAAWQGVGFTHGVLNTDNVSLLGLTIDYGPYGFLDHYTQHYVPNTSDDMGRYAFNKQPDILIWNLEKFALALSLILNEEQNKRIVEIHATLAEYVRKKILQTYLLKLGLKQEHETDAKLVKDLLDLMEDATADFTMTFRQLAELDSAQLLEQGALENKWALQEIISKKGDKWRQWCGGYQDRLAAENVSESERRKRMFQANPLYVPRNWMMQAAIADAETNDFEKVRFLLKIFQNPYELNEDAEKLGYSSKPPSWSYGIKLSCSS